MGVDDVGRRTWDNGANVLFVAVTKYADDKLNVLHAAFGKRAVNCGKTVARLRWHAFCQHSVWVVVSVVVVKELIVVVRVGQLKWHCFQEHVNLVDRQNTVVKLYVCVARDRSHKLGGLLDPIGIVGINSLDSGGN